MVYKWRKEPPDSDGVWAYSEDGVNANGVVMHKAGNDYETAWFWCRIGDVPVIEQAVKYRTPTAADVGREIEVRHSACGVWMKRYFIGFDAGSFVCRNAGYAGFKEARIVDDGKPVLKSREWWIHSVDGYCFGAPTKEASEALVQPSSTFEKVHVREVIE